MTDSSGDVETQPTGENPDTPTIDAEAAETAAQAEGGCHGGKQTLMEAAQKAGKSEVLQKLHEDYPTGPHDQPQSMCPAFGSLRVGLRMRRTATILSGSACCVYGLTFTSHFYGARRTVGYVPFNSETLVTGELYQDIKDGVEKMADPDRYDAVVIINLCVPTASGIPLDRLPKEIDGVRVIGIDVPGFGVPSHAEAKDILAGAMLKYAREEAEAGPVPKPDKAVEDWPTVTMLGEMFPADPVGVRQMLEPMGMKVAPNVPTREWRDLYAALDSRVCAATHPFYVRSVEQFQRAGREVVGSGPVGVEGTADWLERVGVAAGIARAKIDDAKAKATASIQAALNENPIDARMIVSGYEGSELLVARLLIEAGADVPYVGTAVPRTEWSKPDLEWLESKGCHVQYRASLEQDAAAMDDVQPDLTIGTTPLVQKAKERGWPGIYFTNMVSARPLFGAAGVSAMANIVKTHTANDRFKQMVDFFEGVGQGHTAGYGFTEVPSAKRKMRKAKAEKRDTGVPDSVGT
jgi:chlorophyllide a reductase subunit Y